MDVKKAILHYLYLNGSAIRQEIMKGLRMRLNNIVAACDSLLDEGRIRKEDRKKIRSVRLELVPEKFLSIGAEHLPDRFVMTLMNGTGRELERRQCLLPESLGGRERLDLIVEKLSAFRRELVNEKKGDSLAALGLVDVGILDPATGKSIYAAHVKDWAGQEIRETLREKFSCHVEVLSRSDAGCYMDIFRGGKRKADNLIYMIVKGGIGASLVLHGNFLREYLPSSGEMHIRVREEGPLCSCGKRGCLETISSADGLLLRFREEKRRKKETGRVALQDLLRLAEEGDPCCVRLLEEGGTALGRAAADLAGFTGISRIVLRSEVSDDRDIYMESFRRALGENVLPSLASALDISCGPIGKSDAPAGAALYSLNKYFTE